MKGVAYAHTFQNAKKYNMVAFDIDEYGVIEWAGKRENKALFDLAEANEELLWAYNFVKLTKSTLTPTQILNTLTTMRTKTELKEYLATERSRLKAIKRRNASIDRAQERNKRNTVHLAEQKRLTSQHEAQTKDRINMLELELEETN